MADDAFIDELCTLLKVPPKDEIISYALTFQNKRDLESYIKDILGEEFELNKASVQRCLSFWRPSMHGLAARQKSEDGGLFSFQKGNGGKQKNNGGGDIKQIKTQKKDVQKMIVKEHATSVPYKEKDLTANKSNSQFQEQSPKPIRSAKSLETTAKAKKKSPKFVSLYTAEGKSRAEEIMVVPGRHGCECAGQKHKLVSNCLECGRIVCEQEGSGPCLFCGNLVCTGEEQEVLARNSRASEKLYEKLMKKTPEERQCELEKAKALKDKLIHFDRTSARRTKVIDDQADYYSADSKWLTKKQKTVAKKKESEFADQKHQSRLNRKYVLDFAGREVREDIPMNTYMPPTDEEDVEFYMEIENRGENQNVSLPAVSNVNPKIKTTAPTFTELNNTIKLYNGPSNPKQNARSSLRIQDDDIQKISDNGLCLSMHQPWASLLVMGIKTVEGRSWYTPHRGRLWIASTAKLPDQQQIQFVQDQYKALYDGHVEFPENYPPGALLGCVDVVDCVNQEEYQKMDGDTTESGSEFVFVCENPLELLIKVPVKGKHKIWKLETQIHRLAKASIMQQ
eukprot:Seg154.6 transcript_id=Seg154.6/GoldUCD/mRNA.D3Y31 product="Activating signal cointegrator 1" protein_id=Seg154.6/GoldUCD/D3Y31